MKKEKVTKIHVMVSEKGKDGAVYCGHCGCKLNELKSYNSCPDCSYKFEGTIVGGSSWYIDTAGLEKWIKA